jgi:hypothetical protein
MQLLARHYAGLLLTITLPSIASAQLLHHYQFNGNANDAVGGANGTLLNGATATGGRLRLDGVNDYVQFGTQLVPTTSSFTLALFATRLSTQTAFSEFVSQGQSGSGVYIGLSPNAAVTRFTDLVPSNPFSPAINAIVHYGITYDRPANLMRCFIAGIQACNVTVPINFFTTAGSNTRLGRQFDPFGEFFHGELSDVRVYGNALSSADMLALANGVTTVPEPSTWTMLAFGAVVLVFARRRARPE